MKFFAELLSGIVKAVGDGGAQKVYEQYQKLKGRNTGSVVFYCDNSKNQASKTVVTFIKTEGGTFILDDGSHDNKCGVRKDNKRIFCCHACFQKNKALLHKLYKQKRRQWGSEDYLLENLIKPFKDFRSPPSLIDMLRPQLEQQKVKHQGKQTWKCPLRKRAIGVMRAHDNQAGSKLFKEGGTGLCGTRKDNSGTWCCKVCWASRFD